MSEIWRDTNGHLWEIESVLVSVAGDGVWLFGHVTCPGTCDPFWERAYHQDGTYSWFIEKEEYEEGRTFGWWRVTADRWAPLSEVDNSQPV